MDISLRINVTFLHFDLMYEYEAAQFINMNTNCYINFGKYLPELFRNCFLVRRFKHFYFVVLSLFFVWVLENQMHTLVCKIGYCPGPWKQCSHKWDMVPTAPTTFWNVGG